jgi:cation diffusion facilitator CzcD-associated flavoprotein CzcO
MFPTAVQVGEYLASYAEKLLKPGVLSLGCKVTGVQRSESNDRWMVTWSSRGQASETAEFDHLIMACGFFSQPYLPSIPGLDTFPGTVLHSSAYTDPSVFTDRHVAIIGGSFSSAEVAGDIAHLVASVHHVTSRPLYIFPKYIPLDVDDPGSTFLPSDFVLYRRSSQPHNQQTQQERWKKTHEYMRSICGDPVGLSPGSKIDMDMPPYVAISDLYANYVRSGCIKVHSGRLASISSELTITSDTLSYTLPSNITDIIFATGFHPSSASTILPPTLLSDLDFAKSDTFLPFLLHCETLHSSFRNAGFVGYYRGPFWGIIELQARWCVGLFSGSLPWPTDDKIREGILRAKTMRNSKPRVQFPRGGYVGFGTELANEVGVILPPLSSESNKRLLRPQDFFSSHLLTLPSPLQPSDSDDKHATEPQPVLRELEHILNLAATSGLFVAAAVFRSLHGSWIINRSYSSRHPEYPSGASTGTAEFIPRQASSSSSTSQEPRGIHSGPKNLEYLYSEQTELTTSAGLKLAGTKQYIYQYDEPTDKLEVFFSRRDAGSSLDSLFHRVDFDVRAPLNSENAPPPPDLKTPWEAKGSHCCGPDTYEVKYMFYFKGADIERWKIKYEVKGPKKDYSMETWYMRE